MEVMADGKVGSRLSFLCIVGMVVLSGPLANSCSSKHWERVSTERKESIGPASNLLTLSCLTRIA